MALLSFWAAVKSEITQKIVKNLGVQILQTAFAEADKIFNAERDRHKVIIKNNGKTRRLLTVLGEVTLHRRLYYDKTASRYFFAVDELLGLESYTRIEKGMQTQLISDATRSSYGKAAEIAEKKVSRQTVHNLVRRLKDEKLSVRAKGYRSLNKIFIEADEDHIHLNNGTPAEVRLIYVHEGVREVCRGRRELINPKYFVSVSSDYDVIWSEVADYVYSQYKTSSAQLHIAGDGAQWIKYGLRVFPKAKYHLDKFHVSHILSARMSSRPMGWSKAGAYRIARLRAFYFNGGDFRDVVTNQPKLSESGRENTKEKYSGVRFNISNDGQPNLSDYPLSGHVVGIDGLTDKYSSILRAIIRNKKNLF